MDSNSILKKPLIIGEFGRSSKLPGYSLEKRNSYFQRIYNAIYNSARSGGSLVGGLFWQLLSPGMDNMGDGYEVVLEQSPSTANIIAQQSHKLSGLTWRWQGFLETIKLLLMYDSLNREMSLVEQMNKLHFGHDLIPLTILQVSLIYQHSVVLSINYFYQEKKKKEAR